MVLSDLLRDLRVQKNFIEIQNQGGYYMVFVRTKIFGIWLVYERSG